MEGWRIEGVRKEGHTENEDDNHEERVRQVVKHNADGVDERSHRGREDAELYKERQRKRLVPTAWRANRPGTSVPTARQQR